MPSKKDPTQPVIDLAQQRIRHTAADWFAKFRNGYGNDEQYLAFQQWLSANPLHQRAYQDIEKLWHNPDFAAALTKIPLSRQANNPARSFKQFCYVVSAIAACLPIATLVWQPNVHCLTADYCTQTTETRTIQLADGSTIILNTQSAVKVNLGQDLRSVQLVKGEALFEVSRNPERPFVVNSQFGQTRVLGTQFTVREQNNRDTVSVIQGTVAVNLRQQAPVILKANDQVTLTAQQVSPVNKVASTSSSAWAKGYLVFENANLDSVMNEIGRYQKGAVIFKNKQAKKLKVNGRFDIKHSGKALEALEQTLPIKLYRLTPWLTVIA